MASFWKKKKKHQRALSSQNLKTKHKTYICSTIIASLGAIWVPKEVKFFREFNFFGLVRCFSAKIEQTSKNRWKMAVFQRFWPILSVFWSLLNFDWKTAHQTKKIDFPEEFRFFWYPCCPQTRDNSGWMKYFSFLLVWCAFLSKSVLGWMNLHA